ncbi:PREDICTED: uncharacterized protein LOC105151225 isoform X1 [Acromyrmex echinatior]|uniref:uncharacterized protein LOC105151225 isoform X1 n=1 Tax=Acromyrmex echinatior TaxID=103372 RepID=UPI000580C66C|nr:PREDICTED: uncharacterized protein LOC105151225 isoform X1 [Acromyrmex echinatior]
MLCCVPKRLADGGPFYDEALFHDGILFHDETDNSPPPSSIRKIQIELFPEDAPSPILFPCAICARTFTSQSLEKHTRICERAAAKKRKPFDSAKQRIQGTELAEFQPKQEIRRHQQDERSRSTWKKTHDDFLRTIREARGDVMDSRNQCNSLISSGAPTRANEKGTCPTCNRQFGIKAYDRHVAWCKDRVIRMPVSPATNLAKERLEARMRYRAPTLKNRRAINREKYSPGSAANQAAKVSLSSPALVKPKETISSVSCNRESPVKQKPAIMRRPGQLKDSPPSSGPIKSRLADRMNRKIELETRPAWCNYVRRRPDFNLVLKARTGICKDYDPFLLAEQQMNDLLSDTSDQSMTGSPKVQQTRDTLYPLSHSSAFVKYPPTDKRSSLIAPPTEFDDLLSNFSSDSTETNSISREVFLKPNLTGKDATDSATSKPVRELGRRVIIDKSKALGVDERRGVVSADRPRKIFDKDTLRNTGSLINRSNSIRASSAPRINSGSDRKTLGDIRKGSKKVESQRSSDQSLNQRNNNYSSLSGSNLSLNSIISSSELDVKRSNSMFDELMTSFEEDTFPGLKSFLNNESFDLSSPGGDRQRNGSLISDEELSSPDSYKPQDHSKLSNDSAYSSLNRKYSHHGRSTNDVIDRLDEDVPGNGTSPIQTMTKCKMSKFCHECGQRFPETAKFCCECGVKRLAL